MCSGIGGFELGLEHSIPNAGTVWQVEIDPYCRSILAKHWPHSERFSDVKTVGKHNLQPVEICCFGWPCQDHSNAGSKLGLAGEKSSIWGEVFRVAFCELRPPIIVMEQVPAIASRDRGFGEVLGAISEIGYSARFDVISCAAVGSVHRRDRMFFICWRDLTDSESNACNVRGFNEHNKTTLPAQPGAEDRADATDSDGSRRAQLRSAEPGQAQLETAQRYRSRIGIEPNPWHKTSGSICPVDDGLPGRVAMLRALGNSISPQVAAVVGLKVGEVLKALSVGRDPARVLGF
tara:strand:+ start:250 stop:1122 length:873 start_codon:yes stop_codon:yes gene_type:complete